MLGRAAERMALQQELTYETGSNLGLPEFIQPEAVDQVSRFERLDKEQRRLVLNCLHPKATSGDLLAVVAHPSRIELTELLVLARRQAGDDALRASA
jgi:hypothetical protein